jgi:hypothetical protein
VVGFILQHKRMKSLNASYLPSPAVKVQDLNKVGRKLRRPEHNFMVKYKPFTLQPFLIAPVLPGDTLKNVLMQANVITDAVKHPYLGWWTEFYFFYVKLRDLPERDSIEQMLIANAAAPAATAASTPDYYAGEGVNWVKKCLDRVTDCYFRSQEEIDSGVVRNDSDGRPQSKLITVPGWMESMMADNDVPASDGTPMPGDLWPALPDHLAGFQAAYTQWQEMQSLEIVPPRFEDYLKTFGVTPPRFEKENPHIPELIRYIRLFKQPKNVVSPTGGVNSQVVWDVSERADKDRFCAEPGFIFGVTTTRAKMYSGNQKANMSSFLDTAYSWLPALLSPEPFTSLRKFTYNGEGPLDNLVEDYWVDIADLFTGGDQFTNHALTDPGFAGTPVDADAIQIVADYAPGTAIDSLFVDAAGGKNLIKVEGRCDLTFLSRVQDTTP